MISQKFIGCSGYYYNHWKGLFYPDDLAKSQWLPFYAENFNTVEINSSFYHMPLDSTLTNWYKITPLNFVFTLKGPRYITHIKKLNPDSVLKNVLNDFQKKAWLLKDKLGCVLWQLPKSQKANPQRLEDFCKLLDQGMHHVFEFRDGSWYDEKIYAILKEYNISLCNISSPGNLPVVAGETTEISYFRFHGSEEWYSSNYTMDELEKWSNKIKMMGSNGLYVYFNNDVNGYAVFNARDFAWLINANKKEAV